MKFYIFKSPWKWNDIPLETYSTEPLEYIIAEKAVKYGQIAVVSEKQLEDKRLENVINNA